mgnify:CR=1 FL=1
MGQHYSEEISMYQFFVDDCQIGKEYVTITGSDVNHIKNVLRMRPGEKNPGQQQLTGYVL